MATREELEKQERMRKLRQGRKQPVQSAQPVAEVKEDSVASDNHEPVVEAKKAIVQQVAKFTEPEPPTKPQVGTTDFTRLDISRVIHSPGRAKLAEMGRVPSAMVMWMILMQFQYDVIYHPEVHPLDSLIQRIHEGLRGRDGLLIKDMLKLFEVESDKSLNSPMGQTIR